MVRGMPLPKALEVSRIKGLTEWLALYRAYNAIFKVKEIALTPHGISLPQLHLLFLLAVEQHPLAISELSTMMVKEPNSLTGLVDRTEARGWVTTYGDPRDRRKRLVAFTEAGVNKFEQAFAVTARVTEVLFEKVSSDELQHLGTTCEILSGAALSDLRH